MKRRRRPRQPRTERRLRSEAEGGLRAALSHWGKAASRISVVADCLARRSAKTPSNRIKERIMSHGRKRIRRSSRGHRSDGGAPASCRPPRLTGPRRRSPSGTRCTAATPGRSTAAVQGDAESISCRAASDAGRPEQRRHAAQARAHVGPGACKVPHACHEPHGRGRPGAASRRRASTSSRRSPARTTPGPRTWRRRARTTCFA